MKYVFFSKSINGVQQYYNIKFLSLCFMSTSYLPQSLKDFYETWLKYAIH